jgi:hypothetical protein
VVTPNADTPYSFTWMDLRAEPIVICVPKIEKDRYFSVMLTSPLHLQLRISGQSHHW